MNPKKIGVIAIFLLLIGGVFIYTQTNNKQQTARIVLEQSSLINEPKQEKEKTYTLASIAEHSTEASCWMAIGGKVYDVTSFIPNHPGKKAILSGCGKDATKLFNERPTDNKGPHPESANQELDKLYIGVLK